MLTCGNVLFRAAGTRQSLRSLRIIRFRHSNNTPSEQPDANLPWYRRCIDKFVTYAMSPSSSVAFTPLLVNSAFKTDHIDPSKWSLIYYDFDATRIGYVAIASIATLTISSGIACFDYLTNGKFTIESVIRLMDDAQEFGVFVVIPISLMFVVATVLMRLHSMRVFRIYQSLENPDKFCSVGPGIFRMYRQTPLTRSDIASFDCLYGEDQSYIQLLLSGNAKLGSRSVLLNLESFKTPVHKAYILNEHDTLPQEFHKTAPFNSSTPKKRPSLQVPPAPPPF